MEWTYHILHMRKLQVGGYPFRANDLTLEEWLDLGTVNDVIGRIRREEAAELMMRGLM